MVIERGHPCILGLGQSTLLDLIDQASHVGLVLQEHIGVLYCAGEGVKQLLALHNEISRLAQVMLPLTFASKCEHLGDQLSWYAPVAQRFI